MNIALLVSWHIEQDRQGLCFIRYTHFIYIEQILKMYDRIFLIAPVSEVEQSNYHPLPSRIQVVPLPQYGSFLSAQLRFFSFIAALRSVKQDVDIIYCRVPDPFAWMPALLAYKKIIMHFVGDTVDATSHNEKWSLWKKGIMILGYLPDYVLTLLAARKSTVYTNGVNIAKKLICYGIRPMPVISSTVSLKSLPDRLPMVDHTTSVPHLIYIGYIRYAKGVRLLMKLWELLKDKYPSFVFDVVGGGEMFDEIKTFVIARNLEANVILHGHIDDRILVNNLLKAAHLFIFPSLSEGSPRVVIEAMAQGIPVISTPVGSLPTVFKDREEIRFFDFNDDCKVLSIIDEYILSKDDFEKQRNNAFNKVRDQYNIETFLSTVFAFK